MKTNNKATIIEDIWVTNLINTKIGFFDNNLLL